MSAVPQRVPATYADLEAVPEHLVAEILDGALVTHPRPAPKHAVAASLLGVEIGDAFQRGRSGPGGWVLIDEPELHLGEDVIVPDLAGWRRERFPGLPEEAYFETPPDWVCEVLSPSTERYDRNIKRRVYSRAKVSFCWLLDPRAEIVEAFTLSADKWVLNGVFSGQEAVSAAPFEAISFPLASLWPISSATPHQNT